MFINTVLHKLFMLHSLILSTVCQLLSWGSFSGKQY